MSVTQATNRWEYTPANGVTQLPYTRKIFANTDLKVYKNGTLLTLTTQYTVDGVGSVNGGNVNLVVAANGTDKFVVLAVVTLDQQTVYPSNDKFPAKVHEDGLDKLTMAAQQLNEVDTRTLRIKDTAFESGSSLELNQSKTARASKVLGFDTNGDVTTSVPGADAAAASAAAAATSATNASNSAAAAAASAAAAGLPGSLTGAATKMLRVKADESGYELRTQAQVRADVSAAASGPVTGSGLTIATSRLAGRTTAGAGALEEITVGAGLSLSAGVLTAGGVLPKGIFTGYEASNNAVDATNDIDIAAGYGFSDSATPVLINGGAMVKQADAVWAAGTNAGGRDPADNLTGAKTFHWYAFKRVGGAIDYFCSTSLTPTIPDSGTEKVWIGSLLWDGAAWRPFLQVARVFRLKTPVMDLNSVSTNSTYATRTLTVPSGVRVQAFGTLSVAGTAYPSVRPPDASDGAPAFGVAPGAITRGVAGTVDAAVAWDCLTNTSAQIQTATDTTLANGFYLFTRGYELLTLGKVA